MCSALAIPQLFSQAAIASGSTAGSQMAMALKVIGAVTEFEIGQVLPIARELAAEHDFFLPEPDFTNESALDEYRTMTVPYFIYQMRPALNGIMMRVGDYRRLADGITAEGITLGLLPDIALAGLITYRTADDLLERLERELESGMEGLPSTLSSNNPYFTVPSVMVRMLANMGLLGGGLILFENSWLALGVMLGAVPAIEAVSYFHGKKVMSSRIEINKQRAAALNCYRNSLEDLRALRARMNEIRDEVPAEVVLPEPTTLAMRKAILRVKLGERHGWVDIVSGLPTLEAHADLAVKYYAAETAEGRGRETRILSPNLIHPLGYLEGDKLIGAGYLVYRAGGRDRPLITIDGNSRTHPTHENSVKDTVPSMLAEKRGLVAVKDLLREVVGEGVDIEIVNNVYRA